MKSSRFPSSRKTISLNRQRGNHISGGRDTICDICAQNVPGPEREKIFAFGKCDHYVCYVCSARLRVICEQEDCPICREKLDSVVFSSSRNQTHDKFNLIQCTYNDKYKIYFENESLKNAFNKLLKYECQECLKQSKSNNTRGSKRSSVIKASSKNESQQSVSKQEVQSKDHNPSSNDSVRGSCSNNSNVEKIEANDGSPSESRHREEKRAAKANSPSIDSRIDEDSQGLLKQTDVVGNIFPDVFGLRNHLNFVHKLKLCDLCLTHNKLFPFEYSYYDQAALKKHMKVGEPNTSHRGHPNCGLCHHTFFNTDELIQHMSREHFHCHLCGRHDSEMRIYFLNYENLRDHFKSNHFLCERDHCRHEQFTSAFDSMFDYQVHMVQVHGNSTSGLSRGGARQQRTITLDSAPHRARAISPSRSSRQNLPPNTAIVSTGTMATANSSRPQRHTEIESFQVPQQRLPSRAEFPALGQSSTANTVVQQQTPPTYTSTYPSLPQNNTVSVVPSSTRTTTTLSQRVVAGASSSRPSFVRTLGGGYRPPEQLSEMDFPPLPEQPKTKAKSKGKNKKVKPDNETVPRGLEAGMTLEELISHSLTLENNRANKFKRNKDGSKANNAKTTRNVKQKPMKIQLS